LQGAQHPADGDEPKDWMKSEFVHGHMLPARGGARLRLWCGTNRVLPAPAVDEPFHGSLIACTLP